MKRIIVISALVLVSASAVLSQSLTNDALRQRIRTAGATKAITLDFSVESKTSKVMAVAGNFSKDDVSRSGILAMNFAIGFYYPGDSLEKSPDSFLLTFWVLTKKPRFSEDHAMTVSLPDEMLVIGTARYVAKPLELMEYLNFEVSRENLTKIASRTDVKFLLGDHEFRFTPAQMKLLSDLLVVTEVRSVER